MAQIITAAQFRKEQKEYREIQGQGNGILAANIKTLPAKAQRFYLGSQEESFVFERDLVLELLKQPFAQFLRVYYGAIPDDSTVSSSLHHGKIPGSPTIILGAATHYSPYSDIGALYVEWPTGLDPNGDEI